MNDFYWFIFLLYFRIILVINVSGKYKCFVIKHSLLFYYYARKERNVFIKSFLKPVNIVSDERAIHEENEARAEIGSFFVHLSRKNVINNC